MKEGRRQVEDKKSDSKLSVELDGIKALYNKVFNLILFVVFVFDMEKFNMAIIFLFLKLGMQIASIRSSLEKGLTVSTQLNDHMQSLETWLEETDNQLSSDFPDKEVEQSFLRVRKEIIGNIIQYYEIVRG